MLKKFLITAAIFVLIFTLTSYARAALPFRVFDDSETPPAAINGVHIQICESIKDTECAGKIYFEGLTDTQGYIFTELSKGTYWLKLEKECYETKIIEADLASTGNAALKRICPSPKNAMISVVDSRYNTPLKDAIVELHPVVPCPNNCVTDILGMVSFKTTEPVNFKITKEDFQAQKGSLQPGEAVRVSLEPISGQANSSLTALDGANRLTGCRFVIKDCDTLSQIYDCSFPSCSYAAGKWKFSNKGASFNFFLDKDAVYTIMKPGYFGGQNQCRQKESALKPGENRNVTLERTSP